MAMAFIQFQLLIVLLVITSTYPSCAYPGGFRLSAIRRPAISESSTDLPPECEIHYYTQTLDHFNYNPESYTTFQQRYVLNFKYWGGVNTSSPIFVYVGEEGNIISDVLYVSFIVELASRFKGLLLFIEHRYYGKSLPFGTRNETYKNASTFGYLSSEQALADYAQVITDVKKNLSAEYCPVIAVGGSYGGMLASWFRLKYPHIIIGALASSAPILYFEDLTPQDAYPVVVTNDFKNTSENCYNTIKQSWSEIDKVGAQINGPLILGKIFNVCNSLNSSEELKANLEGLYKGAAQYDNPPNYYVEKLCKAIDGAPPGTDILGQIAAGLNASVLDGSCLQIYDPNETLWPSPWYYQRCTEMVIQDGVNNNDTMFELSPFDFENYTKQCQKDYGVTPKPYWATTQFGGHGIKYVLENFGSNIIFSNGLRDPWSSGGVLEDLSDSIVSIKTDQGAHCLDILAPRSDDPAWLVEQRDREIKIIAFWIAEYYSKLPTKTTNSTA